MSNLEQYFKQFREGIIGINHSFDSPFGKRMPILYADWTASGRCYEPIEMAFVQKFMPFVANTHTDTNTTGKFMTHAYHIAQKIIKKHVNASKDDILISSNSGMTGVINKFQRILGLKIHEQFVKRIQLTKEERPIVFVTHLEHHSNQTSWLETIADVEIINPNLNGEVDLAHFQELLNQYADRPFKIAAVTSCSNVTGAFAPYQEISKMIHRVGGYCFVDFACSAPYIDIDMHPQNDPEAYLDAIYFSPHKFLGGPGATGILVFNKKLYHNVVPDAPGGGTVQWTNPWGEHQYIEDIETREDGGTPAFLQTIKTALAIQLKEKMGVENILKREEELMEILWNQLSKIPNLVILAPNIKHRLGIISFYIQGLNYNLGVKLLNDKFGIQTRGGCSCAGTYGHYLLNIDRATSKSIFEKVLSGDSSSKPGWIRMSIHPTMTNEEAHYIVNAIKELAENFETWREDYKVDRCNNVSYKYEALDNFIDDYLEGCFEQTSSLVAK